MNRNWEKRQNRKNMFLAGAKSAILTAAVIPVLGLAVHGLNELGTVRVENYSVKNQNPALSKNSANARIALMCLNQTNIIIQHR